MTRKTTLPFPPHSSSTPTNAENDSALPFAATRCVLGACVPTPRRYSTPPTLSAFPSTDFPDFAEPNPERIRARPVSSIGTDEAPSAASVAKDAHADRIVRSDMGFSFTLS